jgi:hypothetical protein
VLTSDPSFSRPYLRTAFDKVEVDDIESVSTEGGAFWGVVMGMGSLRPERPIVS